MLEQKVAVAFVTRKLTELEERKTVICGLIEVKSDEREELISRQVRYSRSKEEIRQLVERLQSPANEELFKLRAQIASQLKVLVETLLVGSLGERPRMLATIEKLRNAPGWECLDVISHMHLKRPWTNVCSIAVGAAVRRRLRAMGIRDRPIAPASPWQNGFAERLIGSIRRECLDHVIVLGEAHLRRILKSYARYWRQCTSVSKPRYAGFSAGSAIRSHKFARHLGRPSPSLPPGLSFRYTQATLYRWPSKSAVLYAG